MFSKKGFTLIELLIVVTIIAILAGAAVPYVQEYIDQARLARCKNDLDEIRNALVLYELNRRTSYTDTTIDKLVGPFLTKAMSDPWGGTYRVDPNCSLVYSYGPDGLHGLVADDPKVIDNITVTFRPRMACTRIQWLDSNLNGRVDIGDYVDFYFNRPLKQTTPPDGTECVMNDDLDITGFAANLTWDSFKGPTGVENIGRFSVDKNDNIIPGKTNVDFGGSSTPAAAYFQDLTTTNYSELYKQRGAKSDTLKITAP